MFLILLIVILTSKVGSGVQNDVGWYKGCYKPAAQNAAKRNISLGWHGPAHCTQICVIARQKYAAVQGRSCYCLQTLEWHRKVNSANCSFICTNATHLRCGGQQSFTIFDVSVQVVSNLSMLNPSHVNIANISTFSCQAQLTIPWMQRGAVASRANASSSHPRRTSVLITWSIDGKMVKLSNKSIEEEYKFNDKMHHKFVAVGSHSLCCNVSNKFSWLSKCSTVFGLEAIDNFQVVNINGGHFLGNGLYAVPQHKSFYTEVIVNAASFATFLFNFGDNTSVAIARPNYNITTQNCSHLILRRKPYSYSKRGLFSLNVTAVNELNSRSLIFRSRIIIDGIITGVQIVTKFVSAGESSRIVLNVFGSFSFAKYDWILDNGELRTTNEPFLQVSFSAFKPQYRLKVVVYNNISRVETSSVIYIEPKIRGVTLVVSSNVSSIGSVVILKATPQIDSVSFATSIRYKWELGDGVSLPGTMANLIYRYKTSGRFEALVRVENFVSQAYSENVLVNVYKVITKVDVMYDSFLFGEITRLHAKVVDGSDVTYIWEFGDNSRLVTSNHTVFHKYRKLGNYSVKVIAKNPISVKEDSIELFVLTYYCQKPLVALSRTSYPEYIRVSSKMVLDIDVSVNCSISNKTLYNWKVFRIVDGERVEKSPSEIGISPFVFSERSLILPAYSLSPGKYIVELMVQMKGTIVRTQLSRVVSILPSEIKAIISGGKTILVTRKSPENITLDASKSFDPDDRNFTSFRYQWKCKSILGNGFGDCFKPNATIAVNWTSPTLRLLPSIFVKSSSIFAFIVTVSREGLKRSRAVQFIEVQEKTVRRLNIDCLDCRGSDVNGHKDIEFVGTCSDCRNSTVIFQWRVYFKPRVKVFLHHFGSCVPANGSAWKDSENLNGTNSTAITASTTIALTTVVTSTVGDMVTSSPNREEAKLQKVICESDLEMLKRNWTDFETRSRSKRDIFETSENFARKHDLMDRAFRTWDDTNDEKDENFDDEEAIIDEMTNPARRAKRNIEQRTDSSTSGGNDANVTATVRTGGAIDGTNNTLAPISGESSSSATGNGQSSTTLGDTTGLDPATSGFPLGSGSGRGPNVAGSGSGRGPSNSQGSGRGCEGSLGIAGGAAAGSGGSGAATGCNGNGDGFGKGAQTHRNKTSGSQINGTTETDGSTSGNLVSEDKVLLQDEVKMIREIVNQHILTTDVTARSYSDEFVIKKNTLIPGQLFKVDLIAFWPNDGGRTRIAGRASQYFVTNTGPYLGSCKISPRVGTELKTVFSLDCTHWKDKHHPLTFSVKYWSPTTQQNILIYSGLYSNLKFALPAGRSSNNNTIDIEITVEDTENVKTELCPIGIRVLPMANDSLTVEQEVYSQTIGSKSLLKKYEDTSNKVAVTIFVSNIASTLNRLTDARVSSTSHEMRERVRTRLLQSIYSFNILTEVFALQLSGITRELVAKPNEVSLKSVEWSNSICEKIIYFYNNHGKGVSNGFSAEVAKDIFAVLSSAIFSASNQKVNQLNRQFVSSLIKRSLRIHAQLFQILHQLAWHQTMSSNFLTTLSMPYAGETVNNTMLLDGNAFILPYNFGMLVRNISAGSSKIYAALTSYKSNPFRWGKRDVKIDTKVASLDFWTGNGHAINISNLRTPIKVKLPVTNKVATDATKFSIKLSEMKIHQFNVTSVREAMFIKVEDEGATESSEHYSLQALMSYNKEPNQKVYNRSLKFSERRAVVRIFPSKDASKVYIGILLRASGKVAKKKSVTRNYKLSVYSVSCRFWDETSEVWSTNGCEADAESSTSEIVCSCNHLTAFGGNVESHNGTVTVNSIVDFTRSNELHYLLLTILVIVCLHLLLMVIYSLAGKPNDPFKNLATLPDNHPADLFKYLVIVETGSSYNAGTTGRVSIVVYGEEGHSQIRELTCHNAEQFKRGSTNCVIMSFPDSLGDIKKIRLWHDNGGNSPDWFLKQVIIVDCQSEKKWYFHWNNWLAISEDGKADCEILAKMEPLSYIMQTIFEGFIDYHSWISIFTRPARSKYSCFQRLVTSLTVLICYMTITAVFLNQTDVTGEILGFWDIRWIAIVLSIICSFSVLPVQLAIEAFFRNSMSECTAFNKSDEVPKLKKKTLPDEDITKPSGAVFFMEFNSNTHLSQKLPPKDGDDHIKAVGSCTRAGSDGVYCRMSKWFSVLFVLFSLLFSASGILVTVFYSFSFQRNDVILWMQVLLLSFVQSMFLIEIIKAFILSIRRFYKLNRDEDIREYVDLCIFFQDYNRYSKQEDLTEKQIMVARARARFVRFSKPILGSELRNARAKVVPLRSLLSFIWHASTSLILLLTLSVVVLNSNSTQKYYRSKAVKDMVNSGNKSFESIETVRQFWNWSKDSLVDLLIWKNWHHLRTFYESNSTFNTKIYTFGPAFLEKEEKRDVFLNRSLSNSTEFGNQILLVGQKCEMINILNELESRQWVSVATKLVKISFIYFHPESSLFSNIALFIHVLPSGSLHSIIEVESVFLYSTWDPADKYLIAMQAICILLVVVFLRNEFSSLMDKGMQHLASIWNIVEGMLILFTMLATISYVCLYIITQKTQYLIESIELNDSVRFLDLKLVILCKKVVLFVHATLLFLVIVRSMKLLLVWRKFSLMLSMLNGAFRGIISFSVIVAIITFALAHMGTLIIMTESQNFSRVDLAWRSLWANFAIGNRKSMKDFRSDIWISPSFAVLSGLILFALKKLSSVLYIGEFKEAKSRRLRRRACMITTLKQGLHKLRSKKVWMQLFFDMWNRLLKKQGDQYKVCNLPLENVYEEIEYQVEEVLFRLNNLFDMDGRHEKVDKDDDELTLDSSEEAAYPSSYSTKDSISCTSESLYSEDSGYYRYGEYRCPSISNSDAEYEGPVIHHLEPPRQLFSDLGQKLTPIFGGRYFVKTSWSTFRTPKIQPGSIKMEPPPKVLPPIRKCNYTFEKVSNWSTKYHAGETSTCATAADLFNASSTNIVPNHFENGSNTTEQANVEMGPYTTQPLKLPKALQSMAHTVKLKREIDERCTPIQLPPTMAELRARGRRRHLLKRSQIVPLHVDSERSLSISSENSSAPELSLFASRMYDTHNGVRSSSVDSGIIHSSGIEDAQIN